MIDKKADGLLSEAVDSELQNIRLVHGNQYNSLHEGYAVLLEEVEEAKNELEGIELQMSDLWYCIKHNDNQGAADALRRLESHAFFLLQEACQVCAVTEKFRGV